MDSVRRSINRGDWNELSPFRENMDTPKNENTAQQILDKALKTQEQFSDLFTGLSFFLISSESDSLSLSVPVMINEENLNDVYQRVIEVIDEEQAKDHLLVPAKDKI